MEYEDSQGSRKVEVLYQSRIETESSETMARLLCTFLLVLASWSAFAQSSGAEPPVEHANMFTVVIFIVVFIAACVGYVGYTWWRGRKKGE